MRQPWFERTGDKDLRRSGGQQVIAAHNLCYAHEKVVDCAGEGVARPILVARQRKVAKDRRDVLLEVPGKGVIKGNGGVSRGLEPPARGTRGRKPRLCIAPCGKAPAAGARIVELLAGMRRGLRALDIAARTDARIRKAALAQKGERVSVDVAALGLHELLVPVEAKPAKVLDGRCGRAGLVPGVV